MRPLYFVRVDYLGQCIWGGHFLALDAADARRIAGDAYERDRATGRQHNLPGGPALAACTMLVRRSGADPHNAMNLGD